MAFVLPWFLLFGCVLNQWCSALIYSGAPYFPLDEDHSVEIYLDEGPTDVIIPEPPPIKIYPFTPEEKENLYLKLWKQTKPFPKYEKYAFNKFKYNLNHNDDQECCGTRWKGIGLINDYAPYKLNKPVLQLGYGYPNNHVQQYRNPHVKPVVEHIQGDLKYDFRTKTHSY